jgi:hypothetical protein
MKTEDGVVIRTPKYSAKVRMMGVIALMTLIGWGVAAKCPHRGAWWNDNICSGTGACTFWASECKAFCSNVLVNARCVDDYIDQCTFEHYSGTCFDGICVNPQLLDVFGPYETRVMKTVHCWFS